MDVMAAYEDQLRSRMMSIISDSDSHCQRFLITSLLQPGLAASTASKRLAAASMHRQEQKAFMLYGKVASRET